MRRCLLLLLVVGFTGLAEAHERAARPSLHEDLPLLERLRAPQVPPPMPTGTTALRFAQFFRSPVGPRGLAPTETLLRLDGRRVRLFGYMVLNDAPHSGVFQLAAMPVTLAEQADGAADDLPSAVVTVLLPSALAGRAVPFIPGILMVEGVLSVGARDEPDGRRSYVRLQLDRPALAAVPGVVK
jgi:hypothetical protein